MMQVRLPEIGDIVTIRSDAGTYHPHALIHNVYEDVVFVVVEGRRVPLMTFDYVSSQDGRVYPATSFQVAVWEGSAR